MIIILTRNSKSLIFSITVIFLLIFICSSISFSHDDSLNTVKISNPAFNSAAIGITQGPYFSTFLGGNDDESGWGMEIDASGNIIAAGLTLSADFPDSSSNNSTQGKRNIFVIKLSSDGNLLFSSLIDGTNFSNIVDLALDSAGNIVIVGHIDYDSLPLVNAYQQDFKGSNEAIIVKLTPDGQSTLFSTYFGGNGTDNIHSVIIDSSDNIIISGSTTSTDFPITENAFQNANGGNKDAFISKMSSDGQDLLYSTYLGGNKTDEAYGSGVDDDGSFAIAGMTQSNDFPVFKALQDAFKGGFSDGFAAKFASDGSMIFSTFLGGSHLDHARDVEIDAVGTIFVVGLTFSRNFPVTEGVFQDIYEGNADVFITKLSSDGQLLVSTFLGDYGGREEGYDLEFLSTGDIAISGFTASYYFPTENGYQRTLRGDTDAFLSVLSADCSELVFSTYYGGDGAEAGHRLAVNHQDDLIMYGTTSSANLPTANPYQETYGGGNDLFLCGFNNYIKPARKQTDDTAGFEAVPLLLWTISLIFACNRKMHPKDTD